MPSFQFPIVCVYVRASVCACIDCLDIKYMLIHCVLTHGGLPSIQHFYISFSIQLGDHISQIQLQYSISFSLDEQIQNESVIVTMRSISSIIQRL